MNNYAERKYSVDEYDQMWKERYEKYAEKLARIFPGAKIEHVGSTAVPGMKGKSCIDILVVLDAKKAEERISDMKKEGFEYAGAFVSENSRLFRVMNGNEVLANVHFFPEGHSHVAQMLAVKAYLRSRPDEVKAYSDLKDELYTRYPDDYASYRKYKDQFMKQLIARATGENK